jgi:hypothetical protein
LVKQEKELLSHAFYGLDPRVEIDGLNKFRLNDILNIVIAGPLIFKCKARKLVAWAGIEPAT